MKITYFNFAALVLLLMLLISTYFRGMTKGRTNRAFIATVIEVIITVLFDIAAVALDNAGGGNIVAKYIAHGGYLIGHTFTSLFYLIFLIELTDTWHKFKEDKRRMAALILPIVFYFAHFAIQLCGGPRIFYITAEGVYTRAELFYVGYVTAAFYLTYGFVYIIKYKKLFTLKWIITLFSFAPFVVLAMIVEYLTPSVIIELYANALQLMFLAFVIQRPERMIDPVTELGSVVAFENECRRNLYNEKPFFEILIIIKNYAPIRAVTDSDGMRSFLEQYKEVFYRIDREYNFKAEIYNGRHGAFHIVVTNTEESTVIEAAERLLQELNKPENAVNLSLLPQTSVCVVRVPEDFSDVDSLFNFSNEKHTDFTTDKVLIASSLLARDDFKMSLIIDRILEDAIAFDRLEVFYQPIYSIKDNCFKMAEALMRLKDPEYGYVSPDLFIPAAEQSGSINKLWDFSFHKVCSFIASEAFKQSELKSIDLNLSAVQCMNPKLADSIIETIDAYSIPRSTISIEITETAFAYNEEILAENIEKLAAAGVPILLDDYGTGYSDCSRIVSLPFSIIKLDKGFISKVKDANKYSVIKNTINLIRDVDMKAIAEGVETEADYRELEAMNCDYIQGFYFSKALPQDKLIDFLRK